MGLFSSSPDKAVIDAGACADPVMETLAPRILYSADAAALVAPISFDEAVHIEWQQPADDSGQNEQLRQSLALVVIDDSIEDTDTLLGFLAAEQRRGIELDWLMVDQDTDGIDAVANALAGAGHRYDSIHVFSHGSDAWFTLGKAVVDQTTLASHGEAFASWQVGLQDDADILLYACDFSASEQGKALAENLAAMTGADIASSDDTSGHTALGGDWVLEDTTGAIESPVLVGPQLRGQWVSTLAVTPATPEIPVPADTSQNDRLPNNVGGRQVASNGSMTVVVWERGNEVFFRRFQINGTALDVTDQQIANPLGNKNEGPAVAVASNGDFAIVWDTDDGSNDSGINAQMFNADGTPKARPADAFPGPYSNPNEFRVNSTTAGNQELPAIAVRADDTFVISWSGPVTVPLVGTSEGVAYSIHALDGSFIRNELPASSGVSTDELNAAVASHPIDGTSILVYEQDLAEDRIQVKRVLANGFPAFGNINLEVAGRNLSNPSVAVAANGVSYITASADDNDILLWVIAADNTVLTPTPVQVNEVSGGRLRNAQVSVHGTDSVVVVWETDRLAPADDVAIRQFDGAANPIGLESIVNTYTSAHQHQPSLAVNGNTAVVIWSGDSATDGNGVYLRQMSITQPGVRVTATGTTTTEAGGAVTLAIRLETQPSAAVSVGIGSSDGSEGVPSTIGIAFDAADWDTEKLVTITGLDDPIVDGDVAYNITVTTSSVDPVYNTLSDTIVMLSNVDNDVLPNAPVGPISDTDPNASSVPENTVAGTTVGITAFADDPDPGENVQYSLTGASAGFFEIGLNSGVVSTSATPLDYETNISHTLTVVATSDDSSSSQRDFTVAVIDVDENPPSVNTGQAFSINENSANGTLVGTPVANDVDGATVYQDWTIVGGTGASVFNIDATSGDITVADQSALDFESITSLSLLITVSDGTNTSAVETVTINLSDLNEAPLGADASNTGTENTDLTLLSGAFVFNDPDAGDFLQGIDLHTLPGVGTLLLNGTALDGLTALPLFIGSAALDAGDLVYRPPLNVNGLNVTSFDLAVIDQAGERSVVRTQSVNLNAVDSPPVIASYAGAAAVAIDVAENTSIVGTVSAVDPEGQLIQYISAGLDAAVFDVDPNTGAVQFQTAPDFEVPLDSDVDNRYEITVVATDPGGHSASQALTVNVTNRNDVAPVITPGQSFAVPENAVNGTPISMPAVTDPDGPGTYTNWTIAGGNDSGAFAIDAASGMISVNDARALDFESVNVFSLQLTVSDGSNTSAVQNVTIALDNVNEPPQGGNGTSVATEDTDYVFTPADFAFSDPDVGDNMSAIIISDLPASGELRVNGVALLETASLPVSVARSDLLSGALVYRPAPNAAGTALAAFTFTVVDSSGAQSAPAVQAIDVLPVNDAPGVAGSQQATIAAGSSLTVNAAMLSATDVEDPADSIIYTIEADPSQGVLLREGQALTQGDSFSQADINAGGIVYESLVVIDTLDSISFSVADSDGNAVSDVTLSITAIASTVVAPPPEEPAISSPVTENEPTDTTAEVEDAADSEEQQRSSAALVSPPPVYNPSADGSQSSIASLSSSNEDSFLLAISNRAQRDELATGRWLTSGHYGSDLARDLGGAGLENYILANELNRTDFDRLSSAILLNDFERMRDTLGNDFARQLQFDKTVVASSVAVSTSLSIGYILWLLRSGALLSSVLASIPAWRSIDPLPILASMPNRDDSPHDESLEQMVDRSEPRTDKPGKFNTDADQQASI